MSMRLSPLHQRHLHVHMHLTYTASIHDPSYLTPQGMQLPNQCPLVAQYQLPHAAFNERTFHAALLSLLRFSLGLLLERPPPLRLAALAAHLICTSQFGSTLYLHSAVPSARKIVQDTFWCAAASQACFLHSLDAFPYTSLRIWSSSYSHWWEA